MKINEKNLAAFASSSTPVDREGFLLKRGETNKGYQKRWFVLKGNLLFYFDKKSDKDPVGVIIMEGCTIGAHTNKKKIHIEIFYCRANRGRRKLWFQDSIPRARQ
jgi:sesquipedalian